MRNKIVTALFASSLLASAFLAVPAQVRAVGPVTHWVAASGTPIAGAGESCARPGYVGATQEPITAALDEVVAGDTVHICAGTYLYADDGYNDSIPDDITIEGAGAESTILDGGGDYFLFSFTLAEPEHHATIAGITLQNGFDESYAGAVDIEGGSLSITDSVFTNNRAGDYAGAIYSTESVLTVTNTSFSDNSSGDGGGGAIYIDEAPNTSTISNSTFNRNGSGWGGAIVAGLSDLEVTNSTFSNNYTDYDSDVEVADWGGAGIYVYGSTVGVTNSSFTNNETPATSAGAAIHLFEGSLSVDRSKFTGNRAGQAPAIYSWGDEDEFDYDASESFTVTNSVFVNNNNFAGGDSAAIGHERNGRDLTLTGNTFKNNTGATYGGAVEAWLISGDLTITDNRFIGNRATEGGALWIDVRNGVADIHSNLFQRNRARTGGAIGFECEADAPRIVTRLLGRSNRYSSNTASAPRSSANVWSSRYADSAEDCDLPLPPP